MALALESVVLSAWRSGTGCSASAVPSAWLGGGGSDARVDGGARGGGES